MGTCRIRRRAHAQPADRRTGSRFSGTPLCADAHDALTGERQRTPCLVAMAIACCRSISFYDLPWLQQRLRSHFQPQSAHCWRPSVAQSDGGPETLNVPCAWVNARLSAVRTALPATAQRWRVETFPDSRSSPHIARRRRPPENIDNTANRHRQHQVDATLPAAARARRVVARSDAARARHSVPPARARVKKRYSRRFTLTRARYCVARHCPASSAALSGCRHQARRLRLGSTAQRGRTSARPDKSGWAIQNGGLYTLVDGADGGTWLLWRAESDRALRRRVAPCLGRTPP